MEEVSSNKVPSSEKSSIVNKVAGALLFSVCAVMGLFYSLWKQNWNSAAWCILLELACALLLHFSRYYIRTELHLKFNDNFFKAMKYAAFIMMVCSICASFIYILLGALYKEDFEVKSHYAASPIAFLAGFWYCMLLLECKKYQKSLE